MAQQQQQQQQQSRASSNANLSYGISLSTQQQQQQKEAKAAAMFHDFLGTKPSSSSISHNNDNNSGNNNEASAVLTSSRNPDASPSASQSLGASSAGAGVSVPGGRGGGGLLSTASDPAGERQVPNHLEGIPYYVPRSDLSVAGSKRSNSDSAFTARDGVPQIIGHDSSESLHLMKMLRKAGPGERPKRSADDDQGLFGVQSTRPSSGSLIMQPSTTGSRLDPNKWERSSVQYPPRGSHYVPFTHQLNASRFGGEATAAGASSISQAAAADEGSRTGIKGPGLLSSINAGSGNSERNSTGVQASGSKPRPGTHILEPEASTPSSRQVPASPSRQMTIFYGGQAHVFDDVHTNKADVIMALAGSNGMSWSTTYTPKPTLSTRPSGGGETSIGSGGEYDTGNARINAALLERVLRRRLPVVGSSIPAGVPSSDRIIIRPTGGHHHGRSSAVLGGGKETRDQDQKVEGNAEERRGV